jgi:hypothetical protein
MSSTSARITAAWSSVALAAGMLAAGCAPMTETECRSADWYQVGYRDADTYGLRPQIDQYAYRCHAFGVQAAESSYLLGWVDGYREWNGRVHGSECCGVR